MRRALNGRGERRVVEIGVVDPDPLDERGQVRGQIRAGAESVRAQDRRDHPDRRGLAVGPDDVDRLESPLRMPERGHQPAHAVESEPHPEQLEREQVALGVLEREAHSASRSAFRRASLSRSAWTTADGALSTNPLLDELPLGLRDVLLDPRPVGRALALRRLQVEALAGEDLDRAAGDRNRLHRLAHRHPRSYNPGEPRHLFGRLLVAVGGQPRRQLGAGLHAGVIAPPRSARTASITRASERSAGSSIAPSSPATPAASRPDAPGTY